MATVDPILLTGTNISPPLLHLESSWTKANATSLTFDANGLIVLVRVDPTASAPTATLTITEVADHQGRTTAAPVGISLTAVIDFSVLGPFGGNGWENASGELAMTCTGTGNGDIEVIGIKRWAEV